MERRSKEDGFRRRVVVTGGGGVPVIPIVTAVAPRSSLLSSNCCCCCCCLLSFERGLPRGLPRGVPLFSKSEFVFSSLPPSLPLPNPKVRVECCWLLFLNLFFDDFGLDGGVSRCNSTSPSGRSSS